MSGADDVLQEYFAECREHLDGIETDLLKIEQGGAGADEELVNKVFRAAHSIKGGAGFFDLADMRELAHKAENVLELIRGRQLEPTSAAISVLLAAFDKLRELIQIPDHRDAAAVSGLAGRLEELASSCLPARRKSSVRRSASIATPQRATRLSCTAFDFDSARRGGQQVYLLEYDLLHDIDRENMRPRDVVKELMEYGKILDVGVDLEAAGTLDDEPTNRLPMDVLYASALGPELIGSVVDVPAGHVWKVARNGSCELLPDCGVWAEASPGASGHAAPGASEAGKEESEEAPEPPPPTAVAETAATASVQADATIRLNVAVLDTLMNLAGELVLGRNQLGDAVARGDRAVIQAANQRISIVTSEVQEAVMRTRMQPVGNLFQKFPRLVRDIAASLGKEARLVEEGSEVELDKTIIEGLSDPLTHMVRNAVDHGIETPQQRAAGGKPPGGTVTLRAWHEAGLVVVEVADDGRGLDAEAIAAAAARKGAVTQQAAAAMSREEKLGLVFLAGVSTARQVSDLSGRGVGLNVVKANLDRLGGKVEIQSRPGQGASFRIKLPLTLAIVPSLLVQSGPDAMAIPLVNVQELVRIPAGDIGRRMDRVGSAEVMTLRDGVLPVVRLSEVLELKPERGGAAAEALNVVVLASGSFRYGLVVERLHGTVEIVVKPLGRRLKGLREYAGATILGDGSIALILDIAGLGAAAHLRPDSAPAAPVTAATADREPQETHHLLVFRNRTEQCAVPLHAVARVIKAQPDEIERVGGRRILQHRGRTMPLLMLADTAAVEESPVGPQSIVVVLQTGGREFGLLGTSPVDVVEAALEIDTETLRQPGVLGSVLLRDRTTLMLEPAELAPAAWSGKQDNGPPDGSALGGKCVLVAEDSPFFRDHVVAMLEREGATVLTAPDGQTAWEILEARGPEVDLVLTDIQMPRLDGLELTRRIRARRETAGLPVVMLTSLAAEEDYRRGSEAGATAYCIKLDSDQLVTTLRGLLGATAGGPPAPSGGVEQLALRLRAESEAGEAPAAPVCKGEAR